MASMGWNLGRFGLMWFMVPFGTLAVAGHTLIDRVDWFLAMLGNGFGRAAGILVGQNLGARQPGRAERSAWLAVGFAEGIMVICSVVLLVWPGSVIRIFSPEPNLVGLAIIFLRIAVVSFLVIGFNTVLGQCLYGAGDTLPPMLLTVLRSGLQLFLAFLLPRVTNLGVYGVRWALVIGMVSYMVAAIIYFRLGRWKRKKV